jgi:L-ascorbate metabolism protein UlaG (beta-lactamase superfamily)
VSDVSVFELDGLIIKWFGHASFLIKGSKTIYIDPYVLPQNTEKADVILVTHDHYDHCDVENINKLKKEGTVIVTTTECSDKLSIENIKTVKPGDSVSIDGIKVFATFAYNIKKPFHPKGRGVGFVVEMDGKKIYHAGDTDFVPEMRGLKYDKLDVAILPIGGTYTMNLDEAVEATKTINPDYVIPMHFGKTGNIDLPANPEYFRKVLAQVGVKVKVLEPVQ